MHIKTYGDKLPFDYLKRKFDHLSTCTEACISVARKMHADNQILEKALRRDHSKLYEARKAYRQVTSTVGPDQGPLMNVLSNILIEVEQLYATVAPMAAYHNELHDQGLVLVQKMDGKHIVDRFAVDPNQRQRMKFVRTEEYLSGATKSDPFIRVVGSFPDVPAPGDENEVGLKTVQIAPASASLAEFNAKLSKKIEDEIRNKGTEDTQKKNRAAARKKHAGPRPDVEIFTRGYRDRYGQDQGQEEGQERSLRVVRTAPVTDGNTEPIGPRVHTYRQEAAAYGGLGNNNTNNKKLPLHLNSDPMGNALEQANAVEAVMMRRREGNYEYEGQSDFLIINELMRRRGIPTDPLAPSAMAATLRQAQERVSEAQATASVTAQWAEPSTSDGRRRGEHVREVIDVEDTDTDEMVE
jgi:hypothetical protein